MSARPKRVEVDVGGRRIVLRNLDKVFYPESAFTKGDVIAYYARIAPVQVHVPLNVERAAKARDADRLVFEAKDVLRRVDRKGDLFSPVLTLAQRLPSAARLDRATVR